MVFFGATPEFLYQVAGNVEPVTEHIVLLTGLSPSTRYYYSVGSLVESLVEGEDYHFSTLPPPGAPVPTRIWAMGDSGTVGLERFGNPRQIQVRDAYLAHTAGHPADVWLALGDNAYLSGTDQEYQTQFFNIYSSILPNTCLWSTLGNHELYSSPKDGVFPYFKIFSLPTRGEAGGVPSGTENYYSFDRGNIHFVSLDSELLIDLHPAEMLQWLQADLAANTNEWLIAFWHSPPYSKGSHDSDDSFGSDPHLVWMRENVVPILESYGVDLVLSGHSHNYERSYLLNGHYDYSTTLEPSMIIDAGSGREEEEGAYRKPLTGTKANAGAVYVVAGSSGWATYQVDPAGHPAMFFSEVQAGSLLIDVAEHRMDARFLRDTGVVDDWFTLVKGPMDESFRLSRPVVRGERIRVQWTSRVGSNYQLEWSPRLDSPDWQPVGDPVTATGTRSALEPIPPGPEAGFFRVSELPPPQ